MWGVVRNVAIRDHEDPKDCGPKGSREAAASRKGLAANRAARHRRLARLVAEQFDADEQRTLVAALAPGQAVPASREQTRMTDQRKKRIMRWYHYVAYFFGGAFLANALPHLGNGISGHPFQSPFAIESSRRSVRSARSSPIESTAALLTRSANSVASW
jgi:hypothetical protein